MLYSTQHVFIQILEESRENVDDKFLAGVVLADLSKALDFIMHDLLITKLLSFDFKNDSLCYTNSCLKIRKH